MTHSNETLWHYTDGTSSFGPLSTSVIRQLITTGVIAPGFHLCRDGDENWTPLADVDLDAPPELNSATVDAAHPHPTNAVYRLAKNGKTTGPFTANDLRKLLFRRVISTSDLVWTEGMQDWASVGDLPGLNFEDESTPQPTKPNIPASTKDNAQIAHTSSRPSQTDAIQKDSIGAILVLIPVISAVLMWFCISGMKLSHNPSNMLSIFVAGTILLTAALAAIDSIKQEITLTIWGQQVSGPVGWFLLIAPLWVIGLPTYLFCRKRSGTSNYLAGGIISVIVFIGAGFTTHHSIIKREYLLDYERSRSDAEGQRLLDSIISPSFGNSSSGAQAGQAQRKCFLCNGSGRGSGSLACFRCSGAGTKTTPSGYEVVCTGCGGSGRTSETCRACGGSGHSR